MHDEVVLGRLASGQTVIDRPRSHLHKEVRHLISEALAKISLTDQDNFKKIAVKFDRVIGQTSGVKTTERDEIVYAIRPNRQGYTRFVKNREPEDCSSMVLILKKATHGRYVLITAFVAVWAEVEPWDRNATPEALEYWSNHALIWGSEPVLEDTITTVCPW